MALSARASALASALVRELAGLSRLGSEPSANGVAGLPSACARRWARCASWSPVMPAPMEWVSSGGGAGGQEDPGRANLWEYLSRMKRVSSSVGLPSTLRGEGRCTPRCARCASKCSFATRFPVYAMNATCSGSQTSKEVERTLEMWTPSPRWMPEQRMHMNTPQLTEAHVGLGALQSAHWRFSVRLTSCMSARRFLAACSLLTRLVWPASHVKEAAAALDSVGGEPLSDPRSPLQGGAAPSADDTAQYCLLCTARSSCSLVGSESSASTVLALWRTLTPSSLSVAWSMNWKPRCL
mmetsp:Transcript_30336/g.58308  ORF Transcript_30336/g.58308 Transcript_30336/m.58308 type:complete len:296 (+) Transcript_30336:1368-2255(+)